MNSSNPKLVATLQQFHQCYFQTYQQQHSNQPTVQHDKDWPSPCEKSQVKNGESVSWKPVLCDPLLSFSNMEQALKIELHQDIKTFFGSFYCANLPAKTSDGELELLFLWSKDDFERLQENLLGHLWMKQKLKQEDTVFFAVTDSDDVILSVVNSTGEVWAERVGKKPHRKVADSLVKFIKLLSPAC